MGSREIYRVTMEYADRLCYEPGQPKPEVYDCPRKVVTVLVGVFPSYSMLEDAESVAIRGVIGEDANLDEWQPVILKAKRIGSCHVEEQHDER